MSTGPPQARIERNRRRANVQETVRDAALDLLRQGSTFKDLTVDEIARHAGITRSAFYFYFLDKEDLLSKATAEVGARLYSEADRWWHGDGKPEARVQAALDGVTSVYADHADVLRVVTEASSYDEEMRLFWRALVERFVRATADHLRAEQKHGRVLGIDPDETSAQLVWMVERCCYVQIATGDAQPEELARSLARTWTALLYPQTSSAPRGANCR